MKVKISRCTEYVGKNGTPVESYELEVEKEIGGTEGDVAEVYLALRKILNKGLKEDN